MSDKPYKTFMRILMFFLLYLSFNDITGTLVKVCAQNIDEPGPSTPSILSINGSGSTFLTQTESFFEHLTKLPELESQRIFNKYLSVIASELDMENLFYTGFSELEKLLNAAVNESVDVLTLFTLPVLQQKQNKAIVLDKKILLRLNQKYNLHGLFLVSCPSASENAMIQMEFLVAGQGKLIVGYDKNTTIKHPDYNFVTGLYDYQKFFMMDARQDDDGNLGLFDIQGLSNPNEAFKQMSGPLNTGIKSLTLIQEPGKEKMILIQYELFGVGTKLINCIPIESINN